MIEESRPQPGIVDEARRVLAAAHARSVPVRLIGGVAVRVRAGDRQHPALERAYRDIDVVTTRGQGREVDGLLQSLGYVPNVEFNALQGHSRMLFYDVEHERQLDVFVGAFTMCHAIPINDRILAEPDTVPLAELLLTKLQVVRLNEKDLRDLVALVLHHEVAETDGAAINAGHVARLLADDWGLWRTTRENVEKVGAGVGQYGLSADEQALVRDRLDRLWQRIEAEPKSRGFRLRDRVGDRKRWYDEPEEVG